jgi:hypothetical protein
MPGVGPLPKPAHLRARRNKDVIVGREIEADPSPQPPLPTFAVEQDGQLVEWRWPSRTQEWWAALGRSTLARGYSEIEWESLLDTARVHAAFWAGALSMAPELRLREDQFGITPASKARLRITVAQADKAEDESPVPAARTRRPLTDVA